MGSSDLGGILLVLRQPLRPQFLLFYVYGVSSPYFSPLLGSSFEI